MATNEPINLSPKLRTATIAAAFSIINDASGYLDVVDKPPKGSRTRGRVVGSDAGIWNDDEQIDGLVIVRRGVEKPGRLEVRIERLTDEPPEQRLLGLSGFKAIGGGE